MLRGAEKSYRCLCGLVRNKLPVTVSVRNHYHNPNTAVLERRNPVGMVGDGKYPRLKRRHTVLKKIDYDPTQYTKRMQCILTETVYDLGIKGSLVEVEKRRFRNILYPQKKAIYASPDNLEEHAESIERLRDINSDLMSVMNELSTCHLRIFMNNDKNWRIMRDHIRIAFRQAGVMVEDENIELPDYAITTYSTFIFNLQIVNTLQVKVRATIYPLEDIKQEDNLFEYPLFGNPPVDKEFPVEFIGDLYNTSVGKS